jgi:hypothetical protein
VKKNELIRSEGSYAWVIRARWDGAWFNTVPPVISFSNDRIWVKYSCFNGVDDKFALVPRHFAEKYFNAYHWMFGNSFEPNWWAPGLLWQPESFLWLSMKEQGVPFGRATFPMVLMRDKQHNGNVYPKPQCNEASPWSSVSSLLTVLPFHFDKSNFMLGLERMMMSMCLKLFEEDYGTVVSEDLVFTEHDITLSLTSWNPFHNTQDIINICGDLGIDPVSVIQRIWRRGLPIAPRGGEFESEVNLMMTSLKRMRQFLSTHNQSFRMELKSPISENVYESKLQPASVQSVDFMSNKGVELVDALTGVIVEVYQPFILPSEPPSHNHNWWNRMNSLEQDIVRQLDAHLLTRATWNGNMKGIGTIHLVVCDECE